MCCSMKSIDLALKLSLVDSDNLDNMMANQKSKLQTIRSPYKSFYTAWTLTQQTSGVVGCLTDDSKSILSLAKLRSIRGEARGISSSGSSCNFGNVSQTMSKVGGFKSRENRTLSLERAGIKHQ